MLYSETFCTLWSIFSRPSRTILFRHLVLRNLNVLTRNIRNTSLPVCTHASYFWTVTKYHLSLELFFGKCMLKKYADCIKSTYSKISYYKSVAVLRHVSRDATAIRNKTNTQSWRVVCRDRWAIARTLYRRTEAPRGVVNRPPPLHPPAVFDSPAKQATQTTETLASWPTRFKRFRKNFVGCAHTAAVLFLRSNDTAAEQNEVSYAHLHRAPSCTILLL